MIVTSEIRKTLQANVRAGAALLDEKNPGWRDKINIDDLCLYSVSNCVLGQVYGFYDYGLRELELRHFNDYGFNYTADMARLVDDDRDADRELMACLLNEWKAVLA